MKIGIFGGAFDPPHREHAAMLDAVIDELCPDRVIVAPTADPPHKARGLIEPFERRAAMAELAFGSRFEISAIEKELGGKNYSVDLCAELKRRYPRDEILFIIGSDSLRDLKIWHKPEELAKLVTFAVVPRKDKDDFCESKRFAEQVYGAKILSTSYSGENISSSVLKGKLLFGLPVGADVAESVLKYIAQNGLYREYDGILARLKASQSERLFSHTVRTTLFALRFCSPLALQFRDVFLAAAFHDCAKEENLAEIAGVPRPVVHQFAGAKTASEKYGIRDESVLSAIRSHTTGAARMSKLQKLIYAADKLEEGRDYPDADKLRKLLLDDFEQGFSALVIHNYNYLQSIGAQIDPEQEALYQICIKGEQ